jgi:hypothetical protein
MAAGASSVGGKPYVSTLTTVLRRARAAKFNGISNRAGLEDRHNVVESPFFRVAHNDRFGMV